MNSFQWEYSKKRFPKVYLSFEFQGLSYLNPFLSSELEAERKTSSVQNSF